MASAPPRSASAIPEWLVAEARRRGGLAPVDLARFWADDALANADPFGPAIPQVALGIRMNTECVFAELGMEEDWTRWRDDAAWASGLFRAYNDKAERIVGRRLLPEMPPRPDDLFPPTKALHDVFEARTEWPAGSYAGAGWLVQSAHGEDELKALLDRVDRRNENLRSFLLPAGWDAAKERLLARGIRCPLYRHQRGPVTFAMSVYGVETLIFLLLENPDLGRRFREAILRTMLGIARVLDEEAGYTPETAPHGFSFADDNCALLSPDLYEFFGFPILQGVFARYSLNPGDMRYQHSDSAMAHHLPALGRLDLTGTNFGPTVTVAEIRRHLPHAVIEGQLAPFTFSRNDEEGMVREFLRDAEQAREARGLRFTTAGSINNGSLLTGMRLLMAAIQLFGRYDQ